MFLMTLNLSVSLSVSLLKSFCTGGSNTCVWVHKAAFLSNRSFRFCALYVTDKSNFAVYVLNDSICKLYHRKL